jgi:hypothetical protein
MTAPKACNTRKGQWEKKRNNKNIRQLYLYTYCVAELQNNLQGDVKHLC